MELATLRAKHAALAPVLTERSRRVWAATEAQAIGYGGTALVARATGIATSTIQRGLRELTADEPLAGGRTRRAGGGRKRAIDLDAPLLRDLDALVEPTAPGDPDAPLRWTCQSARTVAVALDGLGHRVSHTVVAELLHGLGYSLQGNAKTREGRQHVDRAAQFRYIARRVRRAQRQQQPTISVDTKKKELVGAFKNAGRTWRPAKTPQRVQVHDFVIPATATTGGKAIPYGIYDLHRNEGWVSVGIDPDTASFAVRSIQRWWQHGSPGVSTSPVAVDHGGCRREQRGAPPVVEVGTAASGQSDGLGDHGLSLSAGYEQVEQDRASVVLAHRDELARHPTRRLGHDREPHWLDAQSVRTPRSVGTRPRPIPGWHHRHRCAAGDGTPRAASLSRRLELHDPSRCSENTKVSNCLTSPNKEVVALRHELRKRLLQYHHQLGRMARVVGTAASSDVLLSGRSVPTEAADEEPLPWSSIGQSAEVPDTEGAEWVQLSECPVCGAVDRIRISPWNKLILTTKAPGQTSAQYDYSMCHACGVLFAERRPVGRRYGFLLANFGEVTAKRGGAAEIPNRVLNPYPLSDDEELRRRAAHGVFVSDHLGLKQREYLAPLMRDRFANSVHVDVIGALLEPRGARVLEVRSRAGTVLDGLRRAWDADVYAMPIWESQQYLLRELFKIPTSELIDFENFRIPFDGTFDLIVCNHMLTHVLRPRAFFEELGRSLSPGGHIYLYNEPDDAEYLAGSQSMLATLNPLHMQAFDQASLLRALGANGFEAVFIKRRNFQHMVLAKRVQTASMMPMTEQERQKRTDSYQSAFDRSVLALDPRFRSRVAAFWPDVVARAVASGVAEYDERGRLRLVAR